MSLTLSLIRWPVALCLMALCWPITAQAADRRLVAVLEFANQAELHEREIAYVTDLVRESSLRLPRAKYRIMTRENILEMLPPGVDLASCEGSCEVETGRNLGADYVITGSVVRFGGQLRISMKLYATRSAELLGQQSGAAESVKALEPVTRSATLKLLAPLKPVQEQAASNGGFGVDLPSLREVSLPEELGALSDQLPSTVNLAELNVEVLERVQAARRAEKDNKINVQQRARNWTMVASHPQASAQIRELAESRAEYWRESSQKLRARCQQIAQVVNRRAEDEKKLTRLLKLDDEVIPRDQKDALKQEFDRAYIPWGAAIQEYKTSCVAVVGKIDPKQDPDGDLIPTSKDRCPDEAEDGEWPNPEDGCPGDVASAPGWFGSWEDFGVEYYGAIGTLDGPQGDYLSIAFMTFKFNWSWFSYSVSLPASLMVSLDSEDDAESLGINMGGMSISMRPLSWPRRDHNWFSLLNPEIGAHFWAPGDFNEDTPSMMGGLFLRETMYLGAFTLGAEYRGGGLFQLGPEFDNYIGLTIGLSITTAAR